MGKEIKKGKKGSAAEYLTRSQAIRKMQVTLTDFRRLCILKGVFPREPKKKFKGSDKTYYHKKDVQYLLHDQLLDKFRSIKIHMKKYRKALHRGEKSTAKRLIHSKPTYTLHYILKERYPTFPDALRDLDDALTLCTLFASFPAHETLKIRKITLN
jgi:pescadillo protein